MTDDDQEKKTHDEVKQEAFEELRIAMENFKSIFFKEVVEPWAGPLFKWLNKCFEKEKK